MFVIGLLVYIGGYILHGVARISLVLFYPNWLVVLIINVIILPMLMPYHIKLALVFACTIIIS